MHPLAKLSVWAAFGVAAVLGYLAIKKSAPPTPASDPSRTPNRVSPSESVPLYQTLTGVVGMAPVISFPDIRGTSANVTQPV
jgi:hypothetical protein